MSSAINDASIAVVGIGCRLPGQVGDPQAFWEFLCRRGNAIREVPMDRWSADALFAADPAAPGRTYARHGGFLEGIDEFDAEFFGTSPREAAHIDPQQRLLLETAHEAMEDGGERWEDAAVRSTGVFVGLFIHDYQHMQFADRDALGAHTGTGTSMSIAANRISYVFDLHGPSVAVDTACSSSLVAVHLACKSLVSGECDYALAGGVNVILKPEMTIAMSKATMLSEDGTCKSFDARANGYVRGEGAGLILLRRAADAAASRSRVYAIIRGSGVNSDGRTKGISVPNGDAQESLTRRILAEARVAPSSVGFIEAHGTGTPVGDPIEAAALGRVFGAARPEGERCLLGSVKSNIGHLESASGIAGLIKAVLCVQRGEIPPNLHFETPNPAIDFDALKLEVVQEQTKWREQSTPRRAAVNSFGFGGTNAHVLIEEAPASAGSSSHRGAELPARLVLPLGAHTMQALRAQAAALAAVLEPGGAELRDVLYTQSQRRSHREYRAAIVGDDSEDLHQNLQRFAAGEVPAGSSAGERVGSEPLRPVFVFTGMGPQWWAMGRELLREEPVFRAELERVDARVQALTGWSLLERMLAEESDSLIQQTDVAQPAIFALQAGLTAMWRQWGLEPAAVIGHSVGEVAALYAAGILTLDDAVTVSVHRSRLQRTTAGSGGMLATAIDLEAASQLLRGREDAVSVAAINSPTSLTLSGDTAELEVIHSQLEAQGCFSRLLQVEVPYHSPEMDAIREALLESLSDVQPLTGSCTYYSATTGRRGEDGTGDAGYWWRNVRQTVRFADAMDAAIADGNLCFLEVGPHPVLRTSIQGCMEAREVHGSVVASLLREQPELESMASALGELHVAGVAIDWERFVGTGDIVSLPPYPWQRRRHWSESKPAELYRKGASPGSTLAAAGSQHALLGGRLDLPTPTWIQNLRLSESAYIKDHCIQGQVVFPGTGYLEMALEALTEPDAEGPAAPNADEYLLLSDVEIGRALYPSENEAARLETTLRGDRWEIHGCAEDEETWVRHASGRCRREKVSGSPEPLDLEGIQERCALSLPADYAYRLFRDVGLEYGPCFQAIQELWYGPREAIARLQLPAALAAAPNSPAVHFLFHPALFDACLHTLFGALNLNGDDSHRRGNVYLPVGLRRLRLYGEPTDALWSHARLVNQASESFEADIRVYDDEGRLVAEVLDLRCQAVTDPTALYDRRKREWMFEYEWTESPAESASDDLDGHWLVFAPSAEHGLLDLLGSRGAACSVVVPGERFAVEKGVYTLPPDSPEDFGGLLEGVAASGGELRGVIHAWCLGMEASSDGAAWQHQVHGAGSLVPLVQAMATGASSPAAPPENGESAEPASALPLWVLTEHTQPVRDIDPILLAHSPVWGLRRVIANEHPQLAVTIVDLDASDESLAVLSDELGQVPADDELAFRDGVRLVHRLQRYAPEDKGAPLDSAASPSSAPRELRVQRRGDLKSMRWQQMPPLDLAEDQVEIGVRASALNFKDVMKATGLLPLRIMEESLWSRDQLGMECAGRVLRVGARVRELTPGDAVLALAPRSFASHVVTRHELVVPNPGLPPETAAGVPVAFLTASVGLEELARLLPGERVLVHAASGGVGQAAIQIAKDIGAEVFATAGSEEKRQLIRDLGVKHVFDSRSLRFAEDVREATCGEGVDVVLNSLAGEGITQSLSVLRDYGRFVELGKMDLDRDFPLGLRPFTRCLSFYAVDLDRMLAQRVEKCGEILRGIQERLASGRLRPVPVQSYAAKDAAEAFRSMASAGHTGKLVVEVSSEEPLSVASPEGVRFRSDASYIITGGLGGFGLQLALWMAEHGAGRLVLLGRRGRATPGADEAAATLRAAGCEVQIEACDVAKAEDVRKVIESLPGDRPLRGVFHAAAVLDDSLLKNLDLERYRRTFAPKALGAWNLHEQTLGLELDHFMCFSSMASVLGNQGSANYCAANAFVDALAHHRRRRGLAGLTVNWGVIADVGMAADEDFYRQNLERNGLQTVHSAHCLELLGLLMSVERVQTTVCPIDFNTWLRLNPAGREGRLKHLLVAGNQASGARAQSSEERALRAELAELDSPAAASAAVETALRKLLSQVFRTDVESIDPKRTLTALGADSLMAIEVKNHLDGLGLGISVTQLLNRSSTKTLASSLLEVYGYAAPETDGASGPDLERGTSSWFVRRAPREDAKLRLFCFPYAGGGPRVYHDWLEHLPAWVDLVAVNLSGHGSPRGEAGVQSIAEAADAIIPELTPLLDRPFALFGHCMGAIVMYEVASRLEHDHSKIAEHLFASGCMAPHLYNSPIVYEQEDDAFLDVLRLISFSGTRALIDDPELRRTMFPLLRDDFRLVAHYGDTLGPRRPLSPPITGVAADNDLFAAPKAMQAWSSYTTGGYDLARLSGDHYFLESDRATVTGLVAAALSLHVAGAGAVPSAADAARVEWSRPHGVSVWLAPERPTLSSTRRRSGPREEPTLVACFPPAGVTAPEFPLPGPLAADFRYEAVRCRPADGSSDEIPVGEMVAHALDALRDRLHGRTVFYGYCLGAMVAYELALRLQREGLPLPERLLVAGAVGPHLYVAPDAHTLPTPKLLELLGVLRYPFAERLKGEPAFLKDRIGLVRADLAAMAQYQYRQAEPLDVPITAVSLRHDLWSYPLRTASWELHTQQPCEIVSWDGDHYHAFQHPEKIHELLLQHEAAGNGTPDRQENPRDSADESLGSEA